MIYKLNPVNTREVIAPDGEVVEIPTEANTEIKLRGVFISVNISLSTSSLELSQTHGKHLQPFTSDALIDTGASMSVISPKVVEQLGLAEVGFERITSVHNVEVRPIYFGRITFPGEAGWKSLWFAAICKAMIA